MVSCGWPQFRIPVSPWGGTKFRRELFRGALPSIDSERPPGKGVLCRKILRKPPLVREGGSSQQKGLSQAGSIQQSWVAPLSDGKGDWGLLNMDSNLYYPTQPWLPGQNSHSGCQQQWAPRPDKLGTRGCG